MKAKLNAVLLIRCRTRSVPMRVWACFVDKGAGVYLLLLF